MLYYSECAGQENEKGEGKESYLFILNSLWNTQSYEVISINDVIVIFLKRLESGRIRRRKSKKRRCVDPEMI